MTLWLVKYDLRHLSYVNNLKYCLLLEKITLDVCYVHLPSCVSNFNDYNTEYTSHTSQVASHKSQVISRNSKLPSKASSASRAFVSVRAIELSWQVRIRNEYDSMSVILLQSYFIKMTIDFWHIMCCGSTSAYLVFTLSNLLWNSKLSQQFQHTQAHALAHARTHARTHTHAHIHYITSQKGTVTIPYARRQCKLVRLPYTHCCHL